MAKVKVLVQPSGLINGQLWPEVDEQMELDDAVAETMAEAGWVELVGKGKGKTEKRPASKAGEEQR